MNELTYEQAQELVDAFAEKYVEMGLEPSQIVDGIARSLTATIVWRKRIDFGEARSRILRAQKARL